MAAPVRVRFAPSPTGHLHLGGLRTALYNYLFARKSGGQFVLRIEDTDRARYVQGAMASLMKTLDWAGLERDEGPILGGPYKPYVQSERTALYKAYSDQLVQSGQAYRCFCSRERLDHVKEKSRQAGKAFIYDKRCRHLSEQEIKDNLEQHMPFVVRMKIPDSGKTVVHDQVYGKIEFNNGGLDDSVLMKSDGHPTYHLANVADDHEMKITHVFRGEEWLPSTPKHIILYRALGMTPPEFVHLPLLLNKNRTKLSKRSQDVHVESYIDEGYLPEALINFVALLGWSPPLGKSEVMSMQELVSEFSIEGLHNSNAMVDKEKLDWFNKQHINRRCETESGVASLVALLKPMLPAAETVNTRFSQDEYLAQAIRLLKGRISHVNDIANKCQYLFTKPDFTSPASVQFKNKLSLDILFHVQSIAIDVLQKVDEPQFNAETLKPLINQEPRLAHLSHSQIMMALRYLITGTKVGAGVIETMEMLGRDEVMDRLAMIH
ncbi:hypothetical protein BZG36_02025 [Bifiguratus adelaidae]|uniref:Glutamate--tRNA ligase, mitochondrial n=1 Tax=Bifiguratus adelaidae TaxID=1938954 RepID=A0A261Y241_9FUNG|nr:hypothetical protein BZG36_02025 [Bifiguratus adelaidae]